MRGDGVEPFCALKVGAFSCFCVYSTDKAQRGRRAIDEYELDARQGACARSDDGGSSLALSPVPAAVQPRILRRPSAGAVSLGRQLSERSRRSSSPGCPDSPGPCSPDAAAGGRRFSSPGDLIRTDSIPEEDEEEAKGARAVWQKAELDNREEADLHAKDVEEVKGFNAAVKAGNYLEAHREMLRLQQAGIQPSLVLGPVLVERVERIWAKYDYSLQILKSRVEDFHIHERNDGLNMKWGFNLENDLLRVVYVAKYPDLDIVKSFAAMQERDLQMPFNHGLTGAEVLGEQGAHDTLWRSYTVSKSTNTKGDNVSIISSLDALDEPPLAALWTAQYTPSEETADLLGVAIPPAKEGYTRSEYSFYVCTFTPMHQQGKGEGDQSRGIWMKVLVETKLPGVVSTVISMMPKWALRRLARSRLEAAPLKFKDFVNTSKELDERVKTGPRREFYAALRQRFGSELG